MPLAPIKNRARSSESKRSRRLKLVRKVIISVSILAFLVGGVYMALLWLNKPEVISEKAPDATNKQNPSFVTHRKPPKDVAIGSSIQSISSPVSPGSNASLTLRTTESATCSVKVIRLDSSLREVQRVVDSGLGDKVADDFGIVTWTWTMPADAAIAKWQADLTCTRDSKSTRSIGEIVVERPKS